MAYGKKFYANYKSSAGYDYYLEIWEKDWGSATSVKIDLGETACRVSFDGGSQKFTQILGGKLSIAFIVVYCIHCVYFAFRQAPDLQRP